MKIEDIREKELKNLYALFKQCNEYFDGSEISFLTDKKQLMLTYYIKFTCTLEEEVSNVLNEMEINPGNTKDSIAEEIVQNLSETISMEIEDGPKEIGYLLSVNRLMSYQIANLQNLQFFNNENQKLITLIESVEEFMNIQKSLF